MKSSPPLLPTDTPPQSPIHSKRYEEPAGPQVRESLPRATLRRFVGLLRAFMYW